LTFWGSIEKEFLFFRSPINIFREISQNYTSLSIENKILSYIFIYSLHYLQSLELLRIARNEMNRNRAFKKGKIEYDMTIEKSDISKYLSDFLSLIDEQKSPYQKLLESDILSHERIKADYILNQNLQKEIFELEDYPHLKGDLRLLLKLDIPIKTLHYYIIEQKIFEQEDISRALLSCGDFGIWIGSVFGGGKYYFGQDRYMEVLLSDNKKSNDNIEIYKQLFNSLKSLSLQQIIENKLQTYHLKDKDLIYYFLKYEAILKDGFLSNIFGWLDYNRADIVEKLENKTRATKYRINVYILAFLDILGEKINFDKLSFEEDGNSIYQYKGKKLKVKNDCLCIGRECFELFGKTDGVSKAVKFYQTK
jgi:hypothetical protein